ncbi:MAG: GntR family transcriptional regulator [Clostridiales bacterium]|nr:GntR family transcriptional regulator [Clostridiales bacterium]
MQYDPNSPIWLQVMTAIKTDIVTGRRPPGEKLPGGRELAVLYTINPNTAARVYQELEREGLCESRRGMGTYVTVNEERIAQVRGTMARQAAVRFADEMEKLGIGRQEAARMILEEEKE